MTIDRERFGEFASLPEAFWDELIADMVSATQEFFDGLEQFKRERSVCETRLHQHIHGYASFVGYAGATKLRQALKTPTQRAMEGHLPDDETIAQLKAIADATIATLHQCNPHT